MRRVAVFFMLTLAILANGSRAQDGVVANVQVSPVPIYATADQSTRKARSVVLLQSRGVPTIDWLPVIDGEARSHRRSDQEVVERAIGAMLAAVKGETGDHTLAGETIVQFGAEGLFSPREQAFMNDPTPSRRDRIDMSWQYEGVHVLFWALGLVPDLGSEDQIVKVEELATQFRELGPEGLMLRARLRPQAELLDATDFIYRLHWAVVEARLKNLPPPAGVNPGVVFERHRALNWLTLQGAPEWDEVPTDT